MSNDRTPLDAPSATARKSGPLVVEPVPTDRDIAAEGPAAAHALINITEELARYLRLVSGGSLTLAVVNNRGRNLRDRQGMDWGEAHEFADRTAGTSTLREVLTAQSRILGGQGAIGRHMAANIDKVAPAAASRS